MTRPFVTARATVGEVLPYPSYDKRMGGPARLIGGTILWAGLPQTLARLKQMPLPPIDDMAESWLHFTISLPRGLRLNFGRWQECWHVCITAMGWPSLAIPWIAFEHAPEPEAHEDGTVQHSHAALQSVTWSGMLLDRSNMKRRCDAAERAIRHYLGLPQSPCQPTAIFLPRRRNIGRMELAEAVSSAFRVAQPRNLAELRAALEPFGVTCEISPNTHGVDSFVFSNATWLEVRGKSISDDLTPKAITARFELNAKIRSARARLDFRRFMAAYAMIQPPLNQILKEPKHDACNAEALGNADRPPLVGGHPHQTGSATRPDPSDRPRRDPDEGEHGNLAAFDRIVGKPGARGSDARKQTRIDAGRTIGQSGPDQGNGGKTVGAAARVDLRDAQDGERAGGDAGGSGGIVRGGGFGRLLTLLLACARKHRFKMRVRLDKLSKAVWLGFSDRSALWVSAVGARLAEHATAGSDAHRFAKAYAEEIGWSVLMDHKNWPVPRPQARGDWLSVHKKAAARLRIDLINAASCWMLRDSPPLDDKPGAPAANAARSLLWLIPGVTGTRASLLLASSEAVGKTPEEKMDRISEIEEMKVEQPDLMVLWFKQGDGPPIVITIDKLLEVLNSTVPKRPGGPPGGGGSGVPGSTALEPEHDDLRADESDVRQDPADDPPFNP